MLIMVCYYMYIFFFKQKTAYEMRISDWSSDVCSSDLETDRSGEPLTRTWLSTSSRSPRSASSSVAAASRSRSRSEEHTSELQSLMRTSYADFCLIKKIYNLIIHSEANSSSC